MIMERRRGRVLVIASVLSAVGLLASCLAAFLGTVVNHVPHRPAEMNGMAVVDYGYSKTVSTVLGSEYGDGMYGSTDTFTGPCYVDYLDHGTTKRRRGWKLTLKSDRRKPAIEVNCD